MKFTLKLFFCFILFFEISNSIAQTNIGQIGSSVNPIKAKQDAFGKDPITSAASKENSLSIENLKNAHLRIFKNIQGKSFHNAAYAYIYEQRNLLAPHFPSRTMKSGVLPAFSYWINNFPYEFTAYTSFLNKLNYKLRKYSSEINKYSSQIGHYNSLYSGTRCSSDSDAILFGDPCGDLSGGSLLSKSNGQLPDVLACNIQASICSGGTAGPFNFYSATPNVDFAQGCLNAQQGLNEYGFIMLNIATSGNLNMLIDGNSANTGFIDLLVFNVPPGTAPCTAVQSSANEIGCSYAQNDGGCNQFGTSFSCNSNYSPAPFVNAGQQVMVIAQNWGELNATPPGSTQFTLTLAAGATTGPLNATINPAGPFCVGNPSVQLTAATGGGTWSGTGVNSSGVFTPSTAGVGTHTVSYVVGNAPCQGSDNETITVTANPDPTINPVSPLCTGSSPVTLTAATGGGTFSGTGVSGNTFNPAVSGAGSFTITYTISGSCGGSDNETIVVNANPNATISPAGPYCTSDAQVTLSAATGGGTWSGSGITNASTGTFNPATAGVGSHTITYSVTSGGCTGTDTETITVNSTADPTINSVAPLCTGDAPVTLTAATGGGTFSGTGVSGNSFNPAVSGAGSFTVTYTISGSCGGSDNETIVVNANPNATINAAGPYCTSDAQVTLSAATGGGTWSGSGITNASAGTFDPATAGVGSHTITYSVTSGGCTGTDTETITVNSSADPTINSVAPLCTGDAPVTLTAATGGGTFSGTGVSGNSFNPAVSGAGSFTVTYTISGSCGGSDNETIVVTANPNATINAAGPFCASDSPFNLTAATGGGTWSGNGITNTSTGTFDPAVAGTGVHTITYTVSSGGCSGTDTESITINSSADPTINPVAPLCTNDAPVALSAASGGGTFSGTGVAGSSFNPAISGAGSFIITYVISGTCGGSDNETIVVTANPDATINAVGALCPGDAPVTLSAATAGGTFSGTGVSGNTFDPGVSGTGTFTITYNVTSGGCSSADTEIISVNSSADPTISSVSPLCTNDAPVTLTAATGGGTFSGTGVSGSTFDPGASGAGTHTVTYTIAGGCGGSDTEDILVTASPNATINPAGPFCAGDAPVNLSAVDNGGNWTGTGITNPSSGTFDPSVAGVGTWTINYDVTSGSCSSSDTVTITVNDNLDPTINSVAPMCSGDGPLNLTAISPGGIWSGTGITNASIGSFDPSVAGAGTHTISYNISGSCGGTDTEDILVTQSQNATINSAGPFCTADAPVNLTAIDNGGTWSGSGITNASSGTFNPAVAGVGNHTITYEISTACGDTGTIQIMVNADADATINPVLPKCTNDSPFNLTAAQTGGTWSGSAGIINPSTGTFDPAVSGAGQQIITYTISGACSDTDTDTIMVNQSADATINPAGPFCQTDPPVNLTAAQSGGTWGGNGIVDVNTGTFNPAIAGSGSHVIMYIINTSCPDSNSITITVAPQTDATIFSQGPYCNTDSAVTLSASPPGGTWFGSGVLGNILLPYVPSPGANYIDTIRYVVDPANCGEDADTAFITLINTPDATVNDPGPMCDTSAPLDLNPFVVEPGGIWGALVQSNGIFDPSTIPDTINPALVTYTNSITMSGVTCSDVDSVYIFIGKVPPAPLTVSDTVCVDEVFALLASDTSVVGTGMLNWYYDSAGVIILADSNITSYTPTVIDSIADSVYVFYVQEQNGNCPSAFSPVSLTVVNIGASFLTTPPDSGEIPLKLLFDNTSFGADSINDKFLWSFGDGDSSSLFNPIHSYGDTGIFTISLTVTDQFGVCIADTTYSIYAKGTSVASPPNVFTPNGDGINDEFNLIHKNISVAEGSIYNRWGELIFKWNSVESGWDGRTLSGTLAPDGVYYYMIKATGKDKPEPNPKTYEFNGYVTLVR